MESITTNQQDEPNKFIENEETEFYRSDLLLSKINKVFHDRKRKQSQASKIPRQIKPTVGQETVVRQIARATGYSENQICYYFFCVGIQKEAEKDADKFDLSKKVRLVYSKTITAEFEKFKAEHFKHLNRIKISEERKLNEL